jgi:hypothetical protein
MHEEEKRLPDLTAFEAALAALTPRVEGLDRERLFFLAGQASVPPGGREADGAARPRTARWAWPAAFAAMTTVAASLLVVLCTRTGPNVPSAGQATPDSLAQTYEAPAMVRQAEPDLRASLLSQWLGMESPTPRALQVVAMASLDSYSDLRERARGREMEPCRPRPAMPDGTRVAVEEPLPYRELLDRLLKEREPGESRGPETWDAVTQ